MQVLLLWDTAATTLEVKLLPSEAVEYASVRCLPPSCVTLALISLTGVNHNDPIHIVIVATHAGVCGQALPVDGAVQGAV